MNHVAVQHGLNFRQLWCDCKCFLLQCSKLEATLQEMLLIRPCEVLSRVANVTILEVANNALRVLLQHRHVIIGSLA